jgi:hypothetical protein
MTPRALWSFLVLAWLRPLERCIMAVDAAHFDLPPIIIAINHHQQIFDGYLNERNSEDLHMAKQDTVHMDRRASTLDNRIRADGKARMARRGAIRMGVPVHYRKRRSVSVLADYA